MSDATQGRHGSPVAAAGPPPPSTASTVADFDKAVFACIGVVATPSGRRATGASEQVRLRALATLSGLLTTRVALHASRSLTLTPFVGNTCAALVDVASHDAARGVREAAIDALAALLTATAVVDRPDAGDAATLAAPPQPDAVTTAGAQRVAQVFPGVFTALAAVATGDFKQGSRLTAAALRCVATVVTVCMCDAVVFGADLMPRPTGAVDVLLKLAAGGCGAGGGNPATSGGEAATDMAAAAPALTPGFRLTRVWLHETVARVAPRLEEVVTHCAAHSHHRVRVATLRLAHSVALHCSGALAMLTVPAVEVLVSATHDELDAVRDTAQALLDECMQTLVRTPRRLHDVANGLKPRFWAAVAALPRVVRGVDARATEVHINRLRGLVTILQGDLPVVLAVGQAASRFATALLQALEMDAATSGDHGVVVLSAASTTTVTEYYRKPFSHITTPRVTAAIGALVAAVGRACDDVQLMQLFGGMVARGVQGRLHAEAAVAVALLAPAASPPALRWAVTHLVSIIDGSHARVDPLLPSAHALRSACMAEAVAACAAALGPNLKLHLHRLLFPLLSLLTAHSVTARQAALGALSHIGGLDPAAQALMAAGTCTPLEALLRANADYLVDCLCAQLPAVDEHPTAPAIAECIARHMSVDAVPLMRDVITAAVSCLHAQRLSSHTIPLLRVLLGLLVGCHPPTAPAPAGSDDTGDSSDTDDGDRHDVNAGRAQLRDWRRLVEQVVDAAHNFLGSNSLEVAQQAFAVVLQGCRLLAPWPRRLHPQLHRLWPSLVPRLRASAPRTVQAVGMSFVAELVAALGAAEFLRQRFVDDVWPAMQRTLRNSCPWLTDVPAVTRAELRSAAGSGVGELRSVAGSGVGAGVGSGGGATNGRAPGAVAVLTSDERVVLSVLRCLHRMAADGASALSGKAWDVVCVLVPFLSRRAPVLLQGAACGVVRCVRLHLDPDAVWLFGRRAAGFALPPLPVPPVPWLPPPVVDGHRLDGLHWAGWPRVPAADVVDNVIAAAD